MNAPTDRQLLRAYAVRRSDAAFAELVRRHIDLVYSAALRMVNDPHLAQDVALARNANKLAAHPVLSGWLHLTAQKRVSRAVERLRENFANRGITTGASGLAGGISTNAVQAASAGLVATISSASMAGTIATAKILVITTLQKSRTASKPANDRIQWLKLAKKLSLLQARDARDRPTELELQRRLEAMSAPEQAIARFKSLASDQQQSLLRYKHPLRVEPGAQRGFVKLVREGMTEDQTDIVSGKHGSYPAMAYEMAHAGFPQVTPN